MSDPKSSDGPAEQYRSVTDGNLTQPMELDEFLHGVGVVMRLPPKQEEKAPPPADVPARAATPNAARRRKSLIVGMCVTASAIILAGISLRAWDNRYSDSMPPTLLGSWRTDAAKYRDRGFTVGAETLQMQRGPSPKDVVTLPIKSVRVRNAQRGRSVELKYEENGVVQTLGLTLEDLDGMSIVAVHNQPEIVWKRR